MWFHGTMKLHVHRQITTTDILFDLQRSWLKIILKLYIKKNKHIVYKIRIFKKIEYKIHAKAKISSIQLNMAL